MIGKAALKDNFLEGWALAKLGDVCRKITDGTHKTPNYVEKGTPFVSTANIVPFHSGFDFSAYQRYITQDEHNELTKRCSPEKGDILISKCGTIGKAKEVDVDYPFSSFVGLALLKPHKGIFSSKFLEYFLNHEEVTKQFEELAPGSTRKTLTLGAIKTVEVPVPPLPEQKRIVAKVEQLLARVNAARERLAKIPAILKRFRQSVLAAAYSGRLTADWREENGFPEIFDRAKLKDVVDSIQIGPFGSLLHKSDYVENGIPVINPTNIANGRIRPSPHVTVTTAKKLDLGRYVLQEHDVVVGRRGEMGRCAVVRKNQTGWICGTGSLFVRPGSALLSDFLHILISSPPAIVYLESASVGSTMTNLNQKIFSNMEIGFPRVEEQHQIVRQVQRLFRLADRIQARLEEAMAYVDKLTQAILAKAFRGELVPAEAELAGREGRSYEPASALLAKIEAQRKDG